MLTPKWFCYWTWYVKIVLKVKVGHLNILLFECAAFVDWTWKGLSWYLGLGYIYEPQITTGLVLMAAEIGLSLAFLFYVLTYNSMFVINLALTAGSGFRWTLGSVCSFSSEDAKRLTIIQHNCPIPGALGVNRITVAA